MTIRCDRYMHIAIGLLAAAVLTGCKEPARTPARPTTKPAEGQQRDERYIAALSVADSFCQAWRNGDESAGRMLLTRRFFRQYSDRELHDAIVGSGNPSHAAFEIREGRRVSDVRYVFDVRLYYTYLGAHADRSESPLVRIVIARDQAGNWLVDGFPVPVSGGQLRPGPIADPAGGDRRR